MLQSNTKKNYIISFLLGLNACNNSIVLTLPICCQCQFYLKEGKIKRLLLQGTQAEMVKPYCLYDCI